MAKEPLELLKEWLRNAYAMEEQSIQVLNRQAERNEHYPELAGRIRHHILESESQASRVRDCLQMLGEDTSAIKTGAAMIMGNIQAIMGTLGEDEIVKNVMFSYTHEHYEIGAYRVLIAAAHECGRPDIANICEAILQEEVAMQQWLQEHIEEVTRKYLSLKAADQKAKR